MAKKLTKEELTNWRKYRQPGCTNLHRVKVDVINLNRTNRMEHEMMKCKIAFELMLQGKKIITEAEECSKPHRRFDVVDITNNDIYEVIFKHEEHKEIFSYRNEGIIPIIINSFTCKICNQQYPIKLKKHKKDKICDICNNCRRK